MAESAQDRQLPASQRKIEKARAEGQVARSRDLTHFAAIGGGVALAAALMPWLSDGAGRLLTTGLRFDAALLANPAAMGQRLAELALQMAELLAPLLGGLALAALAASVLAGGWNFTLKPLAPNLSKINPLAGLGRLVSGQQLTETLKACLLALVLGVVGAVFLARHWLEHAQLLAMPLPAALRAAGALILDGLIPLALVLGAFALVDVPLQRHMLQRRLRMSVEELRQEFKELEGNAEVKSKVKLRMREMANRRMLAAVPGADLVVMNPTHYAVALKYDEGTMAAPRVVAKGADLVALRIRDIATEAKVPVLQAPPLARALYTHTELDQEIPARLFGAVAQVLAWVYQLRDALAKGRPMLAPAPVPEVPADLDPLQADASGRN
ncbi:flagellar export pore protein [Rubrivivax sp. A210]|uniref:EscU/YscU/HrcU family type III secretion system export apparatus switch protein n=1 Tax=Rubrivivax sp. A210 TaxID=2772301 RepID=UPI001918508D|nr:flagellar type III secretion system protein FlhB [Rubrivivax sp. A210]CAD5374758.1 flagellar export pore protein [Rubrivivax sp. A210]